MNYEQKYNEALERAREVYTYYSDDTEQLRKLESIFPELVEDDDEKIRNEIIHFLESSVNQMTLQQNADFANRWLPWLEKQKNVKADVELIKQQVLNLIDDRITENCANEGNSYGGKLYKAKLDEDVEIYGKVKKL